ncbi:MAG TPA: hypothetical protein VHK01_06105 [Lacipirellulaceae bacterium]|jgi:hypothetical protein|nr:hypothetical protein [Lacipirellulaceae bacterium]
MNFLLAARRVDVNKFIEGLSNGDPVAWGILVVFGGLSLFGLYRKFRTF